MRLKDVPVHPAYVVFHDAFDNGAMEVWPCNSLSDATIIASNRQSQLDNSGHDEAGIYRAYEKLPRRRIWKFYPTPLVIS